MNKKREFLNFLEFFYLQKMKGLYLIDSLIENSLNTIEHIL